MSQWRDKPKLTPEEIEWEKQQRRDTGCTGCTGYGIILILLFSFVSCFCHKENIDCNVQTICKHSTYNFQQCPDGSINLIPVYTLRQMSVCDSSEFKKVIIDLYMKDLNQESDSVYYKLKLDNPTTCICNQ